MLPAHLAQNESQGLAFDQPIAQFEIGSMQNFIYLILDWKEKKAAIVDPQKDLERPLQALSENGFELTSIILTHTHFDHTAGVGPLLTKYPELNLIVGERDLHRLSKTILSAKNLKGVGEGEKLKVGQIEIQTLLTPGHSAGAVSYFMQPISETGCPYVFTGDTIFIRDCGRTDLETGSNDELFSSIQKIKKLPHSTVLLVGHHYAKECATTLQNELNESPPFQCKSVAELAALP
jgi:hydroxyacylglutathione hydrolase